MKPFLTIGNKRKNHVSKYYFCLSVMILGYSINSLFLFHIIKNLKIN